MRPTPPGAPMGLPQAAGKEGDEGEGRPTGAMAATVMSRHAQLPHQAMKSRHRHEQAPWKDGGGYVNIDDPERVPAGSRRGKSQPGTLPMMKASRFVAANRATGRQPPIGISVLRKGMHHFPHSSQNLSVINSCWRGLPYSRGSLSLSPESSKAPSLYLYLNNIAKNGLKKDVPPINQLTLTPQRRRDGQGSGDGLTSMRPQGWRAVRHRATPCFAASMAEVAKISTGI